MLWQLIGTLIAFAAFAGLGSLAKTSWRIAGAVGVLVYLGYSLLAYPGAFVPIALPPALLVLFVVGLMSVPKIPE
jgi:hypothetical protein